MPGFIRWQGKNSIAIYVPTSEKYKSGRSKRHYETVKRAPGETDKELEARANARKAELELEFYHGTHPAASRKYTIEKLLLDWLAGPVAEKHAIGELQDSTLEKYTMNVTVHLIPRIGRYLATELTEADLESVYRQMAIDGKGPAVVAGAHRTLHTALNWAIRKHLIRFNPASQIEKKPADPKTVHPTLDIEGVLKFLAAARASAHDAALAVSVLTGARIGEVLGLPRALIKWDEDVIPIVQALKKTGQTPKFGKPKTEKSVREIPLKPSDDSLVPWVADIIRATMAMTDEQKAKRIAKGKPYYDYGLVFCNKDGRPINRKNLGRRAFRAMLERAGLPRMRPHDLRHTFTTLTKELGADSKAVADALGHVDSTQVDRRYGHRTTRAQQRLFDRFYEYLQKRT
jgi:integrase